MTGWAASAFDAGVVVTGGTVGAGVVGGLGVAVPAGAGCTTTASLLPPQATSAPASVRASRKEEMCFMGFAAHTETAQPGKDPQHESPA